MSGITRQRYDAGHSCSGLTRILALQRRLTDVVRGRLDHPAQHRGERDDGPVLLPNYTLVPHVRRDGDPSLLERSGGIIAQVVRAPFAFNLGWKIPSTALRHHPLVTVGMPLGAGRNIRPQDEDPSRADRFGELDRIELERNRLPGQDLAGLLTEFLFHDADDRVNRGPARRTASSSTARGSRSPRARCRHEALEDDDRPARDHHAVPQFHVHGAGSLRGLGT